MYKFHTIRLADAYPATRLGLGRPPWPVEGIQKGVTLHLQTLQGGHLWLSLLGPGTTGFLVGLQLVVVCAHVTEVPADVLRCNTKKI